MHFLVLQHERIEHPASFRAMIEGAGHHWTPVHLNEGEALPALDGVDALWVLGGPMDVWQEDAHPWLKAEKAFIREAVVGRALPYLGLCLGHQLLACALGGDCGRGQAEVGILQVTQTAASPFLESVPDPLDVLQWHGAEVTAVPEGANVLARSPACAVQAMSWGPRAFSTQFHLEVEPDTVALWSAIPEYARSLEDTLGIGAVARLEAEAQAKMAGFTTAARQVFDNWCRECGIPSAEIAPAQN
ncbi:type 1 glutamine amidotransferase [Salipiger sp. P9]|uniref:type 1 glutamine amidotransferase n=1 Tax=Salipiger pentaromativorans TaxID=2943193 RepID=UPI0021587C2B|nr:type 1 glutamine amidotransferase [Salipiger pentaromativorans]MCR8546412.1 type 1 glutamine amidotransferase [Salipiger pentaromativorans]